MSLLPAPSTTQGYSRNAAEDGGLSLLAWI